MWDFFKPRRRKVGAATLVVACVFAGGWVRSLIVADTIAAQPIIERGPMKLVIYYWSLKSGAGHLIAGQSHMTILGDNLTLIIERRNEKASRFPQWKSSRDLGALVPENLKLKWHLCGFGVCDEPDYGWRFMVPYWSIVMPLTLLSTWLLLSKPRQSIPKKVVESTASEAA